MTDLAASFEVDGTLLFDNAAIPLTTAEWSELGELVSSVIYDHVVGGDAGEGHSVDVCRFFNDIDKPRALHPAAQRVHEIIMDPEMLVFYRQFTGTTDLCLRRCQANRLRSGDFIGTHKDQDSNPDYFATIVFHFSEDFEGGEFVTHGGGEQRRYRPEQRTALVNNCTIPHEVTTVTSGERLTLACFLSRNYAASRGPREPFRIIN